MPTKTLSSVPNVASPRGHVDVVLRGLRWAVVGPGAAGAVSSHDRRIDAVRAAQELAVREGVDVRVYGLDGKPLVVAGLETAA